MKAAIYARVSTEEQREKQTIQTQRQFAEKYCELHEISVFDVYSDDGITGTLPLKKRPAGAKLLQDAEAGRFDTMLFYRLDRLGRDPRVTLEALDQLEQLGVKIKSMTEPFDTGDATGRFYVTVLSGVAGLERETFLERSRAGTERLAREGTWLGGISPYGYRVEGKKREARLIVSDEPLPGLPLSEADVIRMIYHLSANEGRSSTEIARRLNMLNIPPSYVKDGRVPLRGKRKQNTAGIWWPGRIRNILVNTTYRGLHQYGRRTKKKRDVIEREVPAIIDSETWEKAQKTLQKNCRWTPRTASVHYLLKSLIKCDTCGLNYSGSNDHGMRIYYRCNGKSQPRGFYGKRGELCPSKNLPGKFENVIWADLETFLRNPGPILETLTGQLESVEDHAAKCRQQVDLIEGQLAGKDEERERIVTLYRRGTIEPAILDRQIKAIETERGELKAALETARERLCGVTDAKTGIDSAETLLRELNGRLDGTLTWELKREIVETLVEQIRVETVEEGGKKQAVVHVTYKFDPPLKPTLVARTHSGSSRQLI
ncbi:MAG: recombinase family protein [Candidatus Eisenbacteria bacterium]|uniref:Recombinase family protein n=1 Tax=Eiseniibacteriota bacterium TaxID=2212470 RepID=A0A948RZW8_UNCEI|nr:recombinase family protein [Candidatus Eisenbacteria bacterium]MBU1948687.1 recombinase family protein [Candidatus Eisenbacteria bacterium]MBU2692654.1 recombinase family protein [Candidatus Eisenbacteria bacterium]